MSYGLQHAVDRTYQMRVLQGLNGQTRLGPVDLSLSQKPFVKEKLPPTVHLTDDRQIGGVKKIQELCGSTGRRKWIIRTLKYGTEWLVPWIHGGADMLGEKDRMWGRQNIPQVPLVVIYFLCEEASRWNAGTAREHRGSVGGLSMNNASEPLKRNKRIVIGSEAVYLRCVPRKLRGGGTRVENKRHEEFMERSSECSESQGDGTAPNGTAWSSLAVIGHSGREGMMEGKEHLEDSRRVGRAAGREHY
ncbi:hypothetical protein B0H13DRAFT_1912626 [Mycena leptocephala]|nr:hypothetical protein B0H13DRAFT_1912626 [Mycena leptocephala]